MYPWKDSKNMQSDIFRYDPVAKCDVCGEHIFAFSFGENDNSLYDKGLVQNSNIDNKWRNLEQSHHHDSYPRTYHIPREYTLCSRCENKLLCLDGDDTIEKAKAIVYFDSIIHENYGDFDINDIPEPLRTISHRLKDAYKEVPGEDWNEIKNSTNNQDTAVESEFNIREFLDSYNYQIIHSRMAEIDKREATLSKHDVTVMIDLTIDNGYKRLELNYAVMSECPSNFGKLVGLEELIMTNSGIRSVPNSISKLINLRYLDFSGSAIEELPEGIAALRNLSYLDVSKTMLHSFPLGIGQLCQLETLEGRGSYIKHVPESLGNLRRLKNLHLSKNSIECMPESIGDLKSLQVLDMSYNKLVEIPDTICCLCNLQLLDLSGNIRLQSLPQELGNLNGLKKINLSRTQIKRLPDSLCNLRNLRVLDLRYCSELKELPQEIGNLSELTELYLDETSIKNLPSSLVQLGNLRIISLSGTQITRLPDNFNKLLQLEELNLSYSNLSRLPMVLDGLKSLRRLDLRHSYLFRLPDEINKLVSLSHLLLGNTRLEIVNNSIGELGNLKVLDLSSTKIKALPESICKLHNLSALYLENNKELKYLPEQMGDLCNLNTLSLYGSESIKTLPCSIDKLNNLCELDLSNTGIVTVPASIFGLKHIERIGLINLIIDELPKEITHFRYEFNNTEGMMTHMSKGVFIKGITLKKQPVSIFSQKKELIDKYFSYPRIPVNETKVVFLGDGYTGKSYAIQRMINDCEKADYITSETHGIDIHTKRIRKGKYSYKIHFWDFGGQKLYESMHRCFLTNRTCYVVTVSQRQNTEFSRALYWVRNIATFAPNAPILIFVNIWDEERNINFDDRPIREEFPNVVGTVEVSAKSSEKDEFEIKLEKTIQRMVEKTESNTLSLPKPWDDLRQEIIKEKDNGIYYINYEEYVEKCRLHGINSPDIQLWLLEWFNDLGECFSFATRQSNGSLGNFKVINPEWLNNAIYRILSESEPFTDTGQITHNGIEELLNKEKRGTNLTIGYSKAECKYVLEVMRKFGLSYNIKEADKEFIPQLIKNNRPLEIEMLDYNNKVRYILKYKKFLPENVIQKFMVSHYRKLEQDKCWKEGCSISLDLENIIAYVYRGLSGDDLRIDVYSRGSVEPWECLQWLLQGIRRINNEYNLSTKEYICDDELDDLAAPVLALILGYLCKNKYYPAEEGEGLHDIEKLLQIAYGTKNLSRAMQKYENRISVLANDEKENERSGDKYYHPDKNASRIFKGILESSISFFGIESDYISEDSEETYDPRTIAIYKLCNQIKQGFRKQFSEKEGDPKDESIVQERLRMFLDAKDYQKGIDYEKEMGEVNYGGKGFRPDFIFPKLNVALEVKYIKDRESKRECIESMSADIQPYFKKYDNIVYVVYDLGIISDVEEFKKDFENNEGVKVILIKK